MAGVGDQVQMGRHDAGWLTAKTAKMGLASNKGQWLDTSPALWSPCSPSSKKERTDTKLSVTTIFHG